MGMVTTPLKIFPGSKTPPESANNWVLLVVGKTLCHFNIFDHSTFAGLGRLSNLGVEADSCHLGEFVLVFN